MAQTTMENVLVDLKGFCAFCLNLENGVSKCFPRPPLGSFELKTFLEYWSIIQQPISNLTELSGPSPTFVITGDSPEVIPFHSNAPPMCSSCSGRFGTILACQNEILQLQLKMEVLKSRVEDCLKEVRDVVTANTSIVNSGVQGHFDESTASFLCRLYGNNSDGLNVSEVPVPEDEESKSLNSSCPSEEDASPSKRSRIQVNYQESSVNSDEDEVKSEAESEDYTDANGEQSQSDFDNGQDEDDEEPLVGSTEAVSKKRKMKDPLQLESKSSGVKTTTKNLGSITLNKDGTFRDIQLCEICREWIPLVDLYDHMRTHVGDYAFRCPLWQEKDCKFAFLSRFSPELLKRHSNECLGSSSEKIPKVRCDLCPEKTFKTILYLWIHLKSAHERGLTTVPPVKTLPCPVAGCGELFVVKQSVEYHLRSHGYLAVREKLRSKGVKVEKCKRGPMPSTASRIMETFSCEICGNHVPRKDRFTCLRNHVGEYAHKCPMKNCGMVYHSRYSAAFINHCQTKSHSKLELKLKCDACEETFRIEDLRNFRDHIERHETLEKNFTCPIKDCGEAFTLRQNVEYHLRLHAFTLTRMKKLQAGCSLCNDQRRSRLTPSDMETHLKTVHKITEEDLVRCKYCDFIFPNREQFLEHIGTHMRKQPVECDLCPPNTTSTPNESFCRIYELQKHYLECHKIGKMYICEYCSKAFGTLVTLKAHKENVHLAGEKVKIFKCEECSKEFNRRIALEAHNIRVHGAEPYRCKFCEKTFSTKHQRYNHEKIHTDPDLRRERRKFPCTVCGYKFPNLGAMKRHRTQVHFTTQNTYKCEVESCGKAYKNPYGLKIHVRRRHQGLRKICEFCGKSIIDEKSLKTHYLIHTGERPFVCDICGLRFRQSAALFTHKKGHEKHGPNFKSRTFDRTPKD